MNSYSLIGYSLPANITEGDANRLKKIVQCFAHASLFGDNVVTTTKFSEDTDEFNEGMKHTVISFELAYSLSPILGSVKERAVLEGVYDSASQATREYIDRPYPRSGNMVCFAVFGEDTNWRKDVDNFIKIPFAVKKGYSVGGENYPPVQIYLVLAAVNSGLSDFYKPLEDYTTYMEIIDADATVAKTITLERNKLNSTIVDTSLTRVGGINLGTIEQPAVLRPVLQNTITTPNFRKII